MIIHDNFLIWIQHKDSGCWFDIVEPSKKVKKYPGKPHFSLKIKWGFCQGLITRICERENSKVIMILIIITLNRRTRRHSTAAKWDNDSYCNLWITLRRIFRKKRHWKVRKKDSVWMSMIVRDTGWCHIPLASYPRVAQYPI